MDIRAAIGGWFKLRCGVIESGRLLEAMKLETDACFGVPLSVANCMIFRERHQLSRNGEKGCRTLQPSTHLDRDNAPVSCEHDICIYDRAIRETTRNFEIVPTIVDPERIDGCARKLQPFDNMVLCMDKDATKSAIADHTECGKTQCVANDTDPRICFGQTVSGVIPKPFGVSKSALATHKLA